MSDDPTSSSGFDSCISNPRSQGVYGNSSILNSRKINQIWSHFTKCSSHEKMILLFFSIFRYRTSTRFWSCGKAMLVPFQVRLTLPNQVRMLTNPSLPKKNGHPLIIRSSPGSWEEVEMMKEGNYINLLIMHWVLSFKQFLIFLWEIFLITLK